MSDSDSDSTDSEAEDANLLVFQRVSKPHNESVLDLEKQAIRRDRSVAVATASRDATQSLQQQTQPVVEIDDTDGLDPEQEPPAPINDIASELRLRTIGGRPASVVAEGQHMGVSLSQ